MVLARRYPEIRIIRLPEINSLQSFIPILRTFSRLEKISLTKINLIQYEIISLLERINLTSLELIDCLLVDDTLWDELVKKTTVFEFKDGILKRYSDLKKMQQHFITDLIHDVISCTDKSKKELIREFIKKLSEDSYKKYFPLVHLGVDLDFRLFSETFEVSAEDSEFTPEQLAKSFIQDFYRAGFKIKTLTFPLDLDEAFFVSIAGMPIKCLRINHITDLAVLKNLPYLEELQLDFTEDDIEGLLKEIPANINKIVLKRVFEEESESEPYLTLEKQADQSYSATVHKLSQGLIALLSSLPQLENFKINISELDLHEIGTFQAQKTT